MLTSEQTQITKRQITPELVQGIPFLPLPALSSRPQRLKLQGWEVAGRAWGGGMQWGSSAKRNFRELTTLPPFFLQGLSQV